MNNTPQSKNFFLISFLPSLVYWYMEEHYSLSIALIAGIILGVLEIILEKVFTKHVHSISKLNLGLIVFLGLISFLGEDGIWFKLQPAITGVVMGVVLLWKTARDGSFIFEMMQSMPGRQLPRPLVMLLERNSGYFMLAYGCFMAFVALKLSSDMWIFFKTIGFYLASFVFFAIQIVWLRKSV
ncbi:MAG: septation protein IspZ [Bacteriovoracaceae bacterium]|nr:septation protein IspZ [Bacteriovoracaceae bacterium]